MKEPALNITLLLTASLAAFRKTGPNQQKLHTHLPRDTRFCNSSLNVNLTKPYHTPFSPDRRHSGDICRVRLTQKLGHPSALSSGQQQRGGETVQNTNRQPGGTGRKLQQCERGVGPPTEHDRTPSVPRPSLQLRTRRVETGLQNSAGAHFGQPPPPPNFPDRVKISRYII